MSIAATATTVFPLPTSPCSRRCIGCGPARSVLISSITLRCAPVRPNGNAAINRSTSLFETTCLIPRESRSKARLRPTSTSCTRNNSSNANRRRASSFSAMLSGIWMLHSAVVRSTSSYFSRTESVTGSSNPRVLHRSRAFSTQPAISQVERPAFSL